MRALVLVAPLLACGGTEPPAIFVPSLDPILFFEAEDDPSDGLIESSIGGLTATCEADTCPTRSDGRLGNAWLFDGEDDHLRIPWDKRLDNVHGFTISMWFLLDPSTGQTLLSRDRTVDPSEDGDGDDDTYNIMQSVWCGDGSTALYFATSKTLPLCGQVSIAGLRWQHLAAAWDGTQKTFFINGQVAATQGTTEVIFDQHDIVIGGNFFNGRFGAGLTGKIDDLRIYERALQPSEVLALPGYPVQ
jgi:hypothetical protein